MWSDTLFAAERAHLLRLLLWAAASVVVGTLIVVVLTVRRAKAPIVTQFAAQALGWGVLELAISAIAWRAQPMRDVSAAVRLDRITWFGAGLDVGLVTLGIALAVVGWMGRRLGVVGAGLGVAVQGLALLVLNLTFLSILARLV
ncbi:MAG TPA: hypothetical protein VFZ21_18950 [Gemmatimonadaceae bacterium]|jgi:hypothetical protein|nr:hypothetical protein [Gemmatimonadaceae bacterium]